MADVDGPVDASAPSDDAVAKTNPPSSVALGSTNSPSSNNAAASANSRSSTGASALANPISQTRDKCNDTSKKTASELDDNDDDDDDVPQPLRRGTRQKKSNVRCGTPKAITVVQQSKTSGKKNSGRTLQSKLSQDIRSLSSDSSSSDDDSSDEEVDDNESDGEDSDDEESSDDDDVGEQVPDATDNTEIRINCERELALYLAAKDIKVKDANGNYVNPLEWWAKHDGLYDILAQLAVAFLSIPATSAPSERIWSRSSQVLTIRRARLNEEVASGIMFVKENLVILRKHYSALTKDQKDALPLEISGLPKPDDTFLASVDAGQDTVYKNF